MLMDILRARWNYVQETLNKVLAHNLYKSTMCKMMEA